MVYVFWLQAQNCDFPLAPANICADAPLLCDLDDYCSNNSAAVNSGTPNAFCGVVENNNWVKFIAGSTEFEIEITVSDCVNGSGLQAQFFATTNCQNFTAVSNCLDPVNSVDYLTASGLEIGQVYYLMMDGKGGDVCDYSYVITSGEILSPAEAIIEEPAFLCDDTDEIALDGSASASGSTITYQWTTDNGAIIGSADQAVVLTDTPGLYQLLVTDTGGCEDSVSVEVLESPLADIAIDAPDVIDCLNNLTVTLNGQETTGLDVSYLWTTSDGNIVSGSTTQNPIVDAPGTYELLVTNQLTSCTAQATVLVASSIDTPVASAGEGLELNCVNPTVILDASNSSTGNDFVYLWTTNDGNILNGTTTFFAEVDQPGTYVFQVINTSNDCVDTDEVIVVENPAFPESAFLQIKNPCFGEDRGFINVDSVIGGTAPFKYAIDSLSYTTLNTFNSLAPGSYLIQVEDATGCQWDTIVDVVSQPLRLVDIGADETIQLGCPIKVEVQLNFSIVEVDTLIWQDSSSCPGCVVQTDTLLENRLYTVRVIDRNGCEAYDEKLVRLAKDRQIFIPNAFSPNGDGLNDMFYVQSGKGIFQIAAFRVFDRWGANVYLIDQIQPNNPNVGWNGDHKGKPLGEGVYVYFADVVFIDGRTIRYKGSISLLR